MWEVINQYQLNIPERIPPKFQGKNVDYIKLNGCAIKRYSLKKSPSLGNLDIKQNIASHLPGQIPQ